MKGFAKLLLLCSFLAGFSSSLRAQLPVVDEVRCKQWVDSVMQTLSLKEKVTQLFIYKIPPTTDKQNMELMRKVVKDYKVGGLLFSGGMAIDQAKVSNEAQRLSDIPLMVTFDGEWGLSMRLKNTPDFPLNMPLGCIQDDRLIYEYGFEMARQCREMGVQVNFAPVADVNINPKNPVINTRSFGENPQNVTRKVIAYSQGLEAGGVLSTGKHFPGHGDTDVDSHKALPHLPFTRERLDSIELVPFKAMIKAGMNGMMVAHLEIPALEPQPGLPASLSPRVVQGLLKDELGFKGLAFTDALEMKGVAGQTHTCLKAIQAGNDLLLLPPRIKEELAAIMQALKSGELAESVVEERCRKVLAYKYRLGLSKKPHVQLSGLMQRLNTPEVEDLILRLKKAAVTVLGNQSKMLPLAVTQQRIAVLSVGAPEKIRPFIQSLPATVTPTVYQLLPNQTAEQTRQLQAKLAKHSCVLVAVTERYLQAYQAFFNQFSPEVPVAYLLYVNSMRALPLEKGLAKGAVTVLAHYPDAAVQRQVAALLYGQATANGRLSASIGNLFKVGDGVDFTSDETPQAIPEAYGMKSQVLQEIDTIAQEGIREGAYPGCQVVVLKNGVRVYDKAFGSFTGKDVPVTPHSVYDVASLTKTTATLLAVMKLYDKGLLNLTDRVGDFLPFLKESDKKNITVRQLLLHESGLPATILFYREAIDDDSYAGTLFKGKRDAQHPVQVDGKTWGNAKFGFRKGLTSPVPAAGYTMQVSEKLWLHHSFKEEYLRKIADAPLRDRRYRYSCVGFIVLQQLVEKIAGMSMDAFLRQEFYEPMGLRRTGYLPLRFLSKEEIVPSNQDKFLRKEELCGYVHDESAAFQGGVSGNAGLFSTAEEVADICQMVLNGGVWNGKRYLSAETCRVFTTTTSKISRRGLGFDKPNTKEPNNSPCAPSAPASVYGHTGFTGTCAWVDPDNQLVYVFLSNRIYPHVWNTKLSKMDIRTRIQEVLYQAISQ